MKNTNTNTAKVSSRQGMFIDGELGADFRRMWFLETSDLNSEEEVEVILRESYNSFRQMGFNQPEEVTVLDNGLTRYAYNIRIK